MRSLRALIRDHHPLAVLLLALALAMKLMVPPGFMIGGRGPSLSVIICEGHGQSIARQISLPRPGAEPGKPSPRTPAADECPYAALGMAGLAGAPPALLAAVLAFILVRGLARMIFVPTLRPAYLRPPLRGPPLPG